MPPLPHYIEPGLSPPARGIHFVGFLDELDRRSIPARAGYPRALTTLRRR